MYSNIQRRYIDMHMGVWVYGYAYMLVYVCLYVCTTMSVRVRKSLCISVYAFRNYI